MVMVLSALDHVKATVDAGALDTLREYDLVKSTADAKLSQAFLDGRFDTVHSLAILTAVVGSNALSKGRHLILLRDQQCRCTCVCRSANELIVRDAEPQVYSQTCSVQGTNTRLHALFRVVYSLTSSDVHGGTGVVAERCIAWSVGDHGG
jgi:hypothetical protein